MKLPTERRWLSLFVGSVGLASTTWAFVHWFQLQRAVEALAKQGMYIDLSPDEFERDARVGFAFIFASVVLLSRRAARNTLIAAVLWFVILDLLIYVSGTNPFHVREPLVEIATAFLLLAAIVLWWRKASLTLMSALGPLYFLINYLLWYLFTQHIKKAADVRILMPPTFLNNALYGAQWWHVLYLLLSLIMLVWMVRLILIERRNKEVGLMELSSLSLGPQYRLPFRPESCLLRVAAVQP